MRWESLVERLEALWVSSGRVDLILLLALRPWMLGGSPWQPPLVGMGVVLSPTPKTLGLSFPGMAPVPRMPWGHLQWKGVFGPSFSSFLGRATPQKTSSSVKERYHFTSSLSSITLSANNRGPPPAGRLFSSA